MHVLAVALPLDDVAQAGLHATLRRLRVRALGGHERKHDGIVAAPLGGHRKAQPRQATADDEHVGMNDFHRVAPGADFTQAGT